MGAQGYYYGATEFDTSFIYDYEHGKGWESDGYRCDGGKNVEYKEKDLKRFDPGSMYHTLCNKESFT